jgi:hypothetical protein
VIALVIVIAGITAASFFLNAVFAFAIADTGPHAIRPAVQRARAHLGIVLGSGAVVGVAPGYCTVVVARHGPPWFAISLSIVIGVMMLCYVFVPSRLTGAKPVGSRRDKLIARAVSGTLGAVVCTPPYVLGRVGVLMLGIRPLLIPGILLVVGFALRTGPTGAVKAIKLSTSLIAGRPQAHESAQPRAINPEPTDLRRASGERSPRTR